MWLLEKKSIIDKESRRYNVNSWGKWQQRQNAERLVPMKSKACVQWTEAASPPALIYMQGSKEGDQSCPDKQDHFLIPPSSAEQWNILIIT